MTSWSNTRISNRRWQKR